MQKERLELLNDLNRAIIQFRGMYSAFANAYGISYHEMLVYYTIREYGFCTQKLICESYLLPKQTIHNVFAGLRREGILTQEKGKGRGREKIFVLSEKGEEYAARFLTILDRAENRAFELLGEEHLRALKDLFLDYDRALKIAFGGGVCDDGR